MDLFSKPKGSCVVELVFDRMVLDERLLTIAVDIDNDGVVNKIGIAIISKDFTEDIKMNISSDTVDYYSEITKEDLPIVLYSAFSEEFGDSLGGLHAVTISQILEVIDEVL